MAAWLSWLERKIHTLEVTGSIPVAATKKVQINRLDFLYKVMDIFLKEITIPKIDSLRGKFPFCLPLFLSGFHLKLSKPITFIVGENGSGKSTLLENLAKVIGFNTLGGNKNHIYNNFSSDNFELADKMKLSWSIKQNKGFFFRAETFFQFANSLDELNYQPILDSYGGKSLQRQSHGESFMSFFNNKVAEGLYILDEPESALSPEKQLSLISILNALTKTNKCQFIIASHSPILICMPNSEIYEIENGKLIKKNYKDTKQFILYKDFLNKPESFLHYLCEGSLMTHKRTIKRNL